MEKGAFKRKACEKCGYKHDVKMPIAQNVNKHPKRYYHIDINY